MAFVGVIKDLSFFLKKKSKGLLVPLIGYI